MLIPVLSMLSHLINENEVGAGLLPRIAMWGSCLVLAGLQLGASVLGVVHFPSFGITGVATVLVVACSGELACSGIAGS
ncbi:hypothetical protein [Streptomyces sp. NPDC001604]|uniref:hypothetical protein n=1 Tax=Streptomyces sp. NPDC001604 TaxID=3364593 RepID=UPI003684C51F